MRRSATTNYGTTIKRCSWCYSTSHSAKECDVLKNRAEEGNVRAKKFINDINGGKRVCGYCAGEDHSSSKCKTRFNDFKSSLVKSQSDIEKVFIWLHQIGFGPGAMISGIAKKGWYSKNNKKENIVVIEDFNRRVADLFFRELTTGIKKNWFPVKAIDTSNEDVRNIYLPFHPVYSPRPTSLKVEIIHKANPDDIENIKSFLECYTNPVMNFDSAEEFFDTGYKFKTGNTLAVEVDSTLVDVNKIYKDSQSN
jgi:hypothetical protein